MRASSMNIDTNCRLFENSGRMRLMTQVLAMPPMRVRAMKISAMPPVASSSTSS